MGLFIIGPFSLAQSPQDSVENRFSEETQSSEIVEDHDTKNLNKVLKDYNNDQEKVLKDANTLNQPEQTKILTDKDINKLNNSNNNSASPLEGDVDPELLEGKDPFKDQKLKALKNSLNLDRIKEDKVSSKDQYFNLVKVALAPLQQKSEKELVQILNERLAGTSSETYVRDFPTITTFVIRLIKDSDALPSLAKILDDQKRLVQFSSTMLMTIIFGFLLKRLFKKDGRSITAAMGFWFIRFIIMYTLRFGIILFFFSDELAPSFRIFFKTFF